MAIITQLTLQKNASRVNVFLDGEFASGLEASVVYKKGLKVGQEISAEELAEIVAESDYDKVYEKALELLNRQKYTKKALKSKLISKGFDSFIVDGVIEKLIRLNLVSDQDFATSFIHSTSNKSKKEIELALKNKGVSSADIARVMEDEEIDDLETARRLADKFMRYKENSKKNIKKLIAYLYRKGFSLTDAEVVARKFGNPDYYD